MFKRKKRRLEVDFLPRRREKKNIISWHLLECFLVWFSLITHMFNQWSNKLTMFCISGLALPSWHLWWTMHELEICLHCFFILLNSQQAMLRATSSTTHPYLGVYTYEMMRKDGEVVEEVSYDTFASSQLNQHDWEWTWASDSSQVSSTFFTLCMVGTSAISRKFNPLWICIS